jgi:hypothetical protein
MNLQFADFDADGHDDIITATFEGTAFVVRGSEHGWRAPEHVLDAKGRPVVLSLYYDMQANAYKNADRSPAGVENAEDHCVSTMVIDWDADGDLDLLLGAKEGRLYLQRNEGQPGAPAFSGVNELLEAGGEPFNVPGGLTAARVVDWDRDGRDDLVCGSFAGGAYWYRNTGVEDAPRFAKPVKLLGAPSASDDGAAGPTSDWYVDVVDYDEDGRLDLVVGGHYQHRPAPRVLNADEQQRLAELDAQLEALGQELQAFHEKASQAVEELPEAERQAALQARYASEDYKELSAKFSALHQETSELRPPVRGVSGVWLYRGLDRS